MVSDLNGLLELTSLEPSLFIAKKPYEPASEISLVRYDNNSGEYFKLRKTNFLSDSNAILVPTDLSYWYKNKDYIKYLSELAALKRVIIFNFSDFIPKINSLDRAIYIRPFLNPGEKSENIVLAPYEIKPMYSARQSHPIFKISFMGYVPKILSRRVLFGLKNSLNHPIISNGAIIRRLMVFKMKKSSLPNEIVVRKHFSGWVRDNSIERQKSYDEYEKLITESRYVLCPRGDGNQSIRFYEALSAGRVPVLLDSKMKLPSQELIDYSKITISLKLTDSVKTWDRIINNFENTHRENFNDFSKKIFEIYDNYLSHEVFLKSTFDNFIIKP
jgi:hypothetical protein